MYPKDYNPNVFVSNPGKRFKVEYIGEVTEGGRIELINSGVTDLWELHNASADSVDIDRIVERFQNGDVSVLSRTQGSYADLTNLPTDLRGMVNFTDGLRKMYDQMDPDKKSAFGSFESWLESAGSLEWFNIMNPAVDINKEEKESEVTE